MLVGNEAIRQLIPHAGEMCLLDAVTAWDESSIQCTTNSHRDLNNPLRRGNQLSIVTAMEYGAQAMAIHGGLLAKQAGQPNISGYLVALRDVKLMRARLDDIEATLTVSANQLLASHGNMVYEIVVQNQDEVVASGRVTVMSSAET